MLSASCLTCSPRRLNILGRLPPHPPTPPEYKHVHTQEFPGVERIVSDLQSGK